MKRTLIFFDGQQSRYVFELVETLLAAKENEIWEVIFMTLQNAKETKIKFHDTWYLNPERFVPCHKHKYTLIVNGADPLLLSVTVESLCLGKSDYQIKEIKPGDRSL